MKAKISEYLGPNKVIAGGKIVKLAVNHPHPPAGGEIEFAEKQILGDAPKVEKVEKVEEKKPTAPAK